MIFQLGKRFANNMAGNQSYTYDVAPVFSSMEKEVVRQLCHLCGFEDGDGISCPGGSISNMYGLNLARFYRDKQVKERGLTQTKRLLIFASAQGAAFMGFGSDSVISVDCDSYGAMIPQDLENKLESHKNNEECAPMMIWCTSGTTVMNGFDPLVKLADICQKNNLWMHVDACLGGGFLVSPRLKEKYFKGIERADSVSWNWHKLSGAPLQTSMFLTPYKSLLHQAHSASASYLFQPDKHYDVSFDSGDASIQCGRKPDAFKIWLMWKARGLNALRDRIEETCEVADYMADRLASHPRFQLVNPEAQGTTVCFWVVPPRIARNFEKNSPEFWKEIDKVAPKLKAKMAQTGLSLITYQPLPDHGLPNFFRCTLTCHPPFSVCHVENMIDILVSLSDDL